MNVLLFSMPDSFEHMPSVAIRMPNGALTSLAGNVDSHHRVAVADLILVQRRVRETVLRLIEEWRPDVVGLSVMTFQRHTALRLVEIVKNAKARHARRGGRVRSEPRPGGVRRRRRGVDFIVRGEGEVTFRELLRALESGGSLEGIAGLWHRSHETVRREPRPPRERVPDRARSGFRTAPPGSSSGYTMLGRKVDVVETSRGCTYDCSFCSIIAMRGRNFHPFDVRSGPRRHPRRQRTRRAIDLHRRRQHHPQREAVRRPLSGLIDARLNDIDYTVQAMTSAIANAGPDLAPLMRQAGFRYVFLGIENVLEEDLGFLKAAAKNAEAGERPRDRQRDAARDRSHTLPRHVRRGRAHRGQPRRYAARPSRRIWRSRAATWIGRTSSTPRPTPRRR